jgi:uncharacterized protein
MSLNEYTGRTVELPVTRISDFGYFLTDGEQDVLLHYNDTDQEFKEGDEVTVFLYVDSNGRLTATTTIPEVSVGEYAWVPVVNVKEDLGVFLEIFCWEKMICLFLNPSGHKKGICFILP